MFLPHSSASTLPKVYPKYSGNFLEDLKNVKFNSVSKNTRAYLNSDNMYLKEDSTEADGCDNSSAHASVSSGRGRKGSNGGEGKSANYYMSDNLFCLVNVLFINHYQHYPWFPLFHEAFYPMKKRYHTLSNS